MIEEARLEPVESGLAPATPGWFVVNARDAAWVIDDRFGDVCIFESDDLIVGGRPDLLEQRFPQLGFTLRVISPGQSVGFYHAESTQEDFLVLRGECLAIIEDEERPLRAWDFVHCPPGTAHVFVHRGEGPCVILAMGARSDGSSIIYPSSDLARRHGAGAAVATTSGAEAYAGIGSWRLGRPPRWSELPWAESATADH